MGPIEAVVTLAVAVVSGLLLGTGFAIVALVSTGGHRAAFPVLLGALSAGAISAGLLAGGVPVIPSSWASDFLPFTLPLAFAGLFVAGILALRPRWGDGCGPWARWAWRTAGAVAIAGGDLWINANRPVLPWAAGGWGHRHFDAALWRQTDPEVSNLRAEMVRSLLRDWRPRGRTRQQIVDTLGDPGSIDFTEAVYEVGMVSGFAVDPDYLVLHFSRQGRCDDWWLYQG